MYDDCFDAFNFSKPVVKPKQKAKEAKQISILEKCLTGKVDDVSTQSQTTMQSQQSSQATFGK